MANQIERDLQNVADAATRNDYNALRVNVGAFARHAFFSTGVQIDRNDAFKYALRSVRAGRDVYVALVYRYDLTRIYNHQRQYSIRY